MPDYTLSSTAAEIDAAVENALAMLLTGATNPTTSTVGTLGQIYKNTTTGDLFLCTAVSATYTWAPLVVNDLTTGGTKSALSAEQGKELKSLVDAKLPSASYTAADVLAKVKTVDGPDSGLDADTLDGKHASDFVLTAAIVNDLTTGGATSALSAEQGKTLKGLVDGNAQQISQLAAEASNRYVKSFKHLLESKNEPACMIVQGDSTGNDETEWVYLFSQYLATTYPNYSVDYRIFSDALQAYAAPTRLQTGAAGDAYVTIPGAAGGTISTPSSTALQITGDIDITVKVCMDNYSAVGEKGLVDKFASVDPRSYNFYMPSGSPYLRFWWTADGTTQITKTSTAAAPVTNGQPIWFRVTLDVDNGAGGYDLKFYTSTDGISWTQLGTTIVGTATTSIATNTAPLYVGTRGNGADLWAGKVYRFILKNGIGANGKVVADFDAGRAYPVGTTSVIDGEGNTWTLGTGVVAGFGSPELLIFNASIAGAGLSYFNDATRFAIMTPIEPQLVIISLGHNQSSSRSIFALYETLLNALVTKYPYAGIVCTSQNPQVDPEVNIIPHAIRCRQIATIAAKYNYGLIDIYRMFVALGDYSSYIVGCHPNTAGELLWKNEVIRFFNSK